MVNLRASHKTIWAGWLIISVTGASLFAYSRNSSVDVRRQYMKERALRTRAEQEKSAGQAAPA